MEERLDIVTNIGKYKIENNIPVIDTKRSGLVIEKAVKRLKNEKVYPLSVFNKDMLKSVEEALLTLRNNSEEMSKEAIEKREKDKFQSLNHREGVVFRDEP